MAYFVYILYSITLERFYVGCTNNIHKRLEEHNNKESNYTSVGVPWTLIWHDQKPNRMAAESLERKLKNLNRERKLKFMRKYAKHVRNEFVLRRIETVT